MPPKNKPMKPQDNSMKGKLLRAGDALRANVAKAKPMVEKIGDKVQTMTGRKTTARTTSQKHSGAMGALDAVPIGHMVKKSIPKKTAKTAKPKGK